MRSLCSRNLLLYFKNKTSVFFSLLGAMISFILFVVFLKQNMVQEWHHMPDSIKMMDLWLIGGTLSVTAITTTLTTLGRMIIDESRGVLNDFYLTDVSRFKIKISYMLSAAMIGFMMQMMMLAVMLGYFALADGLAIPWPKTVPLVILALISALVSVAVNMLIVQFVHRVETMNAIDSVISAAAGFLVGTYIPIGVLPHFAQVIIKLTPGAYVSSLYRQIMMNDQTHSIFGTGHSLTVFNQQMGVQLDWTHLLDINQTYQVIGWIFLAGILLISVTELIRKSHGAVTMTN
ncbi:ABC transporter permease [Lentilactobacillus parakefiri]|uniref:Transport permease protein n=1 Tax=Lentilactobacillus parakefiri TaxID=152332 RepID=A0A269XZK4_9LACO|nr:ABC transporter permease [Lentilactobacillus parakefiri]PAK78669.1 multidrug ABC transporter permease [Lentilactobacillus parakefiri]